MGGTEYDVRKSHGRGVTAYFVDARREFEGCADSNILCENMSNISFGNVHVFKDMMIGFMDL